MKKLFLLLFGILFFTPFLNAQNDVVIDESFYSYHSFNGNISTIVTQDDDKILLGGNFSTFDNIKCNGIVRLNVDGGLDSAFVPFSVFDTLELHSVNQIYIQNDGKILISSIFTNDSVFLQNNLIRVYPDGTLDSTFNNNLNASGGIFAIEILSNGSIIIGGCFENIDNQPAYHIAKLNCNGYFDDTFIFSRTRNDVIYDIEIQSDDKILIAGQLYRNLIRIDSNGIIDSTFQIDYSLLGIDDPIYVVKVVENNKILAGGSKLFKFLNNGFIDPDFTNLYGFDNSIKSIAVDTLGKYVLGGSFNHYNQYTSNFIIRLYQNGTFDTSFGIGSAFNGIVEVLYIQNDNKILVAGSFSSYNGNNISKFVKLKEEINTINIDENIQNPFSVFPNPVIDNLQINNDLIDDIVNVQVYDMSGKLVYQSLYNNQTIIPMNQYTAGNYMIIFKTSKGNFSKKVVKL